jgi:hypothetical protein
MPTDDLLLYVEVLIAKHHQKKEANKRPSYKPENTDDSNTEG